MTPERLAEIRARQERPDTSGDRQDVSDLLDALEAAQRERERDDMNHAVMRDRLDDENAALRQKLQEARTLVHRALLNGGQTIVLESHMQAWLDGISGAHKGEPNS